MQCVYSRVSHDNYLFKSCLHNEMRIPSNIIHPSAFMIHQQQLSACYSAFMCNQKHQMFKIKSVRMLDAFLQKGCKMIETFVTLKSI